jgi:hypothetical protein
MEDVKVQIALITAITTILSVFITQLINLYISRKNRKKETKESELKYLNQKLEKLENLKNELVSFKEESVLDEKDLLISAAKGLMSKLNFYRLKIKSVEHYFNESEIDDIENSADYVYKKIQEIAFAPKINLANKNLKSLDSQFADVLEKMKGTLKLIENNVLILMRETNKKIESLIYEQK